MDLDFVSVHKNAKKELGQYPAILTSRLVNNAYISGSHYKLILNRTILYKNNHKGLSAAKQLNSIEPP